MRVCSLEPINLSKCQARRFMLAHQGLWPPRTMEGKPGVAAYIRRVNCVQFDPLDIVARNHELVLQARVKGFRPPMLYDLLYSDRRLVEGWDKNMSIYCTEDWPYFRRNREAAGRELVGRLGSAAPAVEAVRKQVEERGPLSSADLEMNGKVDWPWGPARVSRAALESMFLAGDLVIYRRNGTVRTYDLAERHLPKSLLRDRDPNKTTEEYHDWHVHRRIGGIGLLWDKFTEGWLGIYDLKSSARHAAVSRLLERGRLLEAKVDDMESALYMRDEDRPTLERVLTREDPAPQASILAPLDNLLWDRQLVKELFGFDYTWEVYKPAPLRKYGYYVLPVLHGDRFVARFEPIRDKKSGRLLIKGWWWEEGVDVSAKMRDDVRTCLREFAHFLGCAEIQAGDGVSEPEKLEWLAT